MNEFLPILLVIVVGLAVAGLQASRFGKQESIWLVASYAAHVVTAFVQLVFTHTMYGFGDMDGYAANGEMLAATMRIDPGQFVPEVIKLLFQQEAMLPVEIGGQRSSTGSMSALSGLLAFLTGGGIYTLSVIVSIGAHFGKVYLYKAFCDAFPEVSRKRLLFAAFFVPSEVFWSCGLIKEGVAMLGLGYAIWGVQRLIRGDRLLAIPSIGFGSLVVGLFKSYILVAIVAGTVAYFFFNAPKRQALLSRPVNILAGALIGAAGSAAILRLFPNYRPDAVAEQAAYYQEMGQVISGGSTYAIGDATRTSFAGQLAFAPIALITSLFRPFIFEARSPQVFVNALETTTILVLLARLFWRQPLARTLAQITSQPMLVFAVAFCIVFGVGVGLTTTNLGTLSRYRMPLVPFLWLFVLVLDVQSPVRASSAVAPLRPGWNRPGLGARASAVARLDTR